VLPANGRQQPRRRRERPAGGRARAREQDDGTGDGSSSGAATAAAPGQPGQHRGSTGARRRRPRAAGASRRVAAASARGGARLRGLRAVRRFDRSGLTAYLGPRRRLAGAVPSRRDQTRRVFAARCATWSSFELGAHHRCTSAAGGPRRQPLARGHRHLADDSWYAARPGYGRVVGEGAPPGSTYGGGWTDRRGLGRVAAAIAALVVWPRHSVSGGAGHRPAGRRRCGPAVDAGPPADDVDRGVVAWHLPGSGRGGTRGRPERPGARWPSAGALPSGAIAPFGPHCCAGSPAAAAARCPARGGAVRPLGLRRA
jgi:hypothetical protein